LSVTRDMSVVFSSTSVSSTNKTGRHDITEILLKWAILVVSGRLWHDAKGNVFLPYPLSEARDHILILNILFFNKLRQIMSEVRSEMLDLLIFMFILKTTGTFTPVHSAGCLILRNELRSTQEIARQNIQVSFYIRSTGLSPNTCVTIFGNNQKRNAHFMTR
jgi:hypothetical protein